MAEAVRTGMGHARTMKALQLTQMSMIGYLLYQIVKAHRHITRRRKAGTKDPSIPSLEDRSNHGDSMTPQFCPLALRQRGSPRSTNYEAPLNVPVPRGVTLWAWMQEGVRVGWPISWEEPQMKGRNW